MLALTFTVIIMSILYMYFSIHKSLIEKDPIGLIFFIIWFLLLWLNIYNLTNNMKFKIETREEIKNEETITNYDITIDYKYQ